MVHITTVENQLKQIGSNIDFWGRTELYELAKVLRPEEHIAQVINGVYDGGFAMLCVTNDRVLLIDKKPFDLIVEDLRYDMITEVDYQSHIIMSALYVCTPMRTLVFRSWNRRRLHVSMQFVQQKLFELRAKSAHHMQAMQQFMQFPEYGNEDSNVVDTRDPLPLEPTYVGSGLPTSREQATSVMGDEPATLINPYTKAPMLSRRRRFPSFYQALPVE